MSLLPELTSIDRRVLAAVRKPAQVGMAWVRVNEGRAHWHSAWLRRDEVEGILRGLEHLGYVRRKRGGWWQAT